MNALRSLLYFISVASPKLGMFLVLFTLARFLPAAEVGLFVLVITVGELLEMVSVQWLRIFVQHREAGRHRISALRAGRMVSVTLAVTTLAILASIPVAMVVADARWMSFAFAVALYIAAFGALRYGLSILQTLRRHTDFARLELARFVSIVLMLAVIVFVEHPKTFFGPSVTLSLSTLVIALWGIVLTARSIDRPRFTRLGLGAAALFGLPMIGDALLSYLVNSVDRLVLNEVTGPAAVGVYGIAYALGRQPIEFVAGPMNNLSVPALFAAKANQGDDAARTMQTGNSLSLFVLCTGMMLGVLGLRHQIVQVLLKSEFWPDSAALLPIITLAACLTMFKMYLFDNVYHLYGRTALKLKIYTPIALASMALTVALVSAIGLYGAAIALAVSSAVALVGSMLGTRSFFRFPLPAGSMAQVLLVACVAAAALFAATYSVRAWGPAAELAAGFLAFCIVYAVGLRLIGIHPKAIIVAPWAPKGV